jgi:hypothetical protein
MVLGQCTWCGDCKNRKKEGYTDSVVDGEIIYGVCSWCKKNDMPVVCPVCKDVYSISDMLKTKVSDTKFHFCCKKELCKEKFRNNIPLLKEIEKKRTKKNT